jgi:aspartyl-tRNA(Asn)/glutamyl-tRNA(Gln) amidotransferase subunit B
MEEGSLRCDANISVRLKGETKFGTKTEVKNMNSFRNVERAINYEIERQTDTIEDGGRIVQQTLLWDPDKGEVRPMRSKEEAHDYRYFPEPDLLPVVIDEKWKSEIARNLPELPDARKQRFMSQFGLPEYDSEVLTQTRPLADYYEKVISVTDDYKSASNWIMGDVLKVLNEDKIDISDFCVSPENIGALVNLIKSGTISGKIAKEVFAEMLKANTSPEEIVKAKNLIQISDTSEIEKIISAILDSRPNEVKEYIEGKEKVFGFFIGQIMKETKGKANPKIVNEILRSKLDSLKPVS